MQAPAGNHIKSKLKWGKKPGADEFIEKVVEERKLSIKKYFTTFTKELPYEDQLNSLTHLYKSNEITEEELKEYKKELDKTFASQNASQIGFAR